MHKKKGAFITFEGCEGCGKTTQIDRLSENLQNLNIPIAVTREPGGTCIGEMIRHILIEYNNSEAMRPETELLLFTASRAQLVRELILPSLECGKFILCDRFLDSTTVYQGMARQLAKDPVKSINKFAIGDLMPDLTIVIDIPADESLRRVQRRVRSLPDRMERESIDFYRAVRDGYLWLAQQYPERFFLVDGMKSITEVSQEIWKFVRERFAIES